MTSTACAAAAPREAAAIDARQRGSRCSSLCAATTTVMSGARSTRLPMMPYRTLARIAIVVAAASLVATAWALPTVGGALPRVEVDDVAAGARRPLPDAHPVLVMYEDKDAQKQN